jgi:hypothetical protein
MTTFTAHFATVGQSPAYLELHDIGEPLQPDEILVIVSDDGRRYRCSVLDHTTVCAIVETRDDEV